LRRLEIMEGTVQQILVCASCGNSLTKSIWIYDEALGHRKKNKGWARIPAPEGSNLSEITMQDGFGEFLSPPNTGLKYQNPQKHSSITGLEFSVRPDSLTNNVKRNDDWKVECCGVYPGNKPNLSCSCGNPFGLEFGDCYTQKYVLPLPRKTKWHNVKS